MALSSLAMKKRDASPLRLDLQTIRTLSGAQLAHAGGASIDTSRLSDATTTQPISIVSISVRIGR